MFITSGFIDVNDIGSVDVFVQYLKDRGIEVTGIKDERIVFLIEREKIGELKKEINDLKSVEEIKNVYITYYSVADSSEGDDREVESLKT